MPAAIAKPSSSQRLVCARVVRNELLKQEGVVRLAGRRRRPLRGVAGVAVKKGPAGGLHVQARIVIRYGSDSHAVGARVQQVVREALERTTDRPIDRIDIVITGVLPQRGTA